MGTYSTYDTSPAATGNYGGASGPRAASVGGKTSAGTPTPPQSAWNPNVSESYHYSNLSPSRSRSGYPRTASSASTVSPAAAASAAGQHAELGDMLSMLGQNAAAAGHHHPSAAVGFASAAENLGGMFTGQFQ